MARIVMTSKASTPTSALNKSFVAVDALTELPDIRVTEDQIRPFGTPGGPIFGTGNVSFSFKGNGFATEGSVWGGFDIVGGRITGLVVKVDGKIVMTVTGWNLSAEQIYNSVQENNLFTTNKLIAAMFGKSDTVIGSRAADRIDGFDGADVLRGNGGADDISGGDGSDRLFGGKGADFLSGSDGRDTMTGGSGADRFVFFPSTLSSGRDQITDFKTGVDDIWIAGFSGVALGLLSNSAFRVGRSAQDADDRIIYDRAKGLLYFDVDGVGGTDKILFAQLDAGARLAASDISNVI